MEAKNYYTPAHKQSRRVRQPERLHGEAEGTTKRMGSGYGAISRMEMLVDSKVQILDEGTTLCVHSPFQRNALEIL